MQHHHRWCSYHLSLPSSLSLSASCQLLLLPLHCCSRHRSRRCSSSLSLLRSHTCRCCYFTVAAIICRCCHHCHWHPSTAAAATLLLQLLSPSSVISSLLLCHGHYRFTAYSINIIVGAATFSRFGHRCHHHSCQLLLLPLHCCAVTICRCYHHCHCCGHTLRCCYFDVAAIICRCCHRCHHSYHQLLLHCCGPHPLLTIIIIVAALPWPLPLPHSVSIASLVQLPSLATVIVVIITVVNRCCCHFIVAAVIICRCYHLCHCCGHTLPLLLLHCCRHHLPLLSSLSLQHPSTAAAATLLLQLPLSPSSVISSLLLCRGHYRYRLQH